MIIRGSSIEFFKFNNFFAYSLPSLSLILMKVVLILRSTASSIEHKNDKLRVKKTYKRSNSNYPKYIYQI